MSLKQFSILIWDASGDVSFLVGRSDCSTRTVQSCERKSDCNPPHVPFSLSVPPPPWSRTWTPAAAGEESTRRAASSTSETVATLSACRSSSTRGACSTSSGSASRKGGPNLANVPVNKVYCCVEHLVPQFSCIFRLNPVCTTVRTRSLSLQSLAFLYNAWVIPLRFFFPLYQGRWRESLPSPLTNSDTARNALIQP